MRRRCMQPLVERLERYGAAPLGLGACAPRRPALQEVIPPRGREVGMGEGRAEPHRD